MNLSETAYKNGKYTYKLALERAKRNNAFPRWADTRTHRNKILQIYIAAQIKNLTSKRKYHVDHIIPLCGHNICGLHVADNLRIISKAANEFKSNTFKPFVQKAGRKTSVTPLIELPEIPWKPPRKGRKNPTNKSSKRLAKKIVFRKRAWG